MALRWETKYKSQRNKCVPTEVREAYRSPKLRQHHTVLADPRDQSLWPVKGMSRGPKKQVSTANPEERIGSFRKLLQKKD